MTRKFRPALIAMSSAALLAGCGSDGTMTPEGPGTVVIEFDHEVDGAPLVLNQMNYTNAAGNNYEVTLLEYIVSNFELHPADESAARNHGHYEYDMPHYRNHSMADTRTLTFTDVPAGTYNELTFQHGMDATRNAMTFSDLDLLGMGWPMQMGGGYHYMRNEGNYIDALMMPTGFTTHTGPSMGNDYSIPVSIDLPDITVSEGQTTTINLVMNVNNWYTTPNQYDFNDYTAIMGNASAQTILQANGADVWSLGN